MENENGGKRGKVPMWFPYTSKIESKPKSVKIVYKGGVDEADWKDVHSIMFYQGVCPLDEKFLDSCRKFKIPVCIHRRNVPRALWIFPSVVSGVDDILTKQILFRESEKKRTHISRVLLTAKLKSMKWLVEKPEKFNRTDSIKEMRIRESMHAKKYWSRYFRKLAYPEYTRRRNPNVIKSVLDATYKFIVGIIIRWIVYHRISPYHAFLHATTEYPSLAYDLVEPYRGYVDKWVFDAVTEARKVGVDEKDFLKHAIAHVKEMLYARTYTNPTRQIVTFHELFHGSVLALRCYLLGESYRFMVPVPSKPNGGRPVKAGYKLYGRTAGPTNFWEEARDVSKKMEEKHGMEI